MIQKDGSILITADEVAKGIAPSPHLGYTNIRNLDIWSTPGVVKIQKKLTACSLDIDSVVGANAFVVGMDRNPVNGDRYVGVNGRQVGAFADDIIYKNPESGTTVFIGTGNFTSSLEDIKVFNDYLIIIGSTTVRKYGPISGVASISDISGTLTAGSSPHKSFVAQNDKLYITNGRYLASIDSSFTMNTTALTLPINTNSKCIVESGKMLVTGVWKGANLYDNSIANLYPWDKNETSFDEPVQLNDYGINQLINENKVIYGQVGIKNKFFTSILPDTKELPEFFMMDGLGSESWINNYANACALLNSEKLFGLSNGGGNPNPLGVYAYKNGAWILRNTISTGNIGDTSAISIYAILPIGQESFLVAWGDDSSKGIDQIDSSNIRYSGDKAFFDSPFVIAGTPLNKRNWQNLEILLNKALTADQTIKLQYRTNLNDSFTTFKTYTSSSFESGAISHTDTSELPDVETIQIRCIFNSTSSVSTEFKQLRIF